MTAWVPLHHTKHFICISIWFFEKSSEIIEKTLQLHSVNGGMRSGKIVRDLPKG